MLLNEFQWLDLVSIEIVLILVLPGFVIDWLAQITGQESRPFHFILVEKCALGLMVLTTLLLLRTTRNSIK
jgi:hypothetical protein